MAKWVNAEFEFESWFPGKTSFVYKFEDARQVIGALQSRRVIVQGRPADYLVTTEGKTFFAEVKSCNSEASFPLSNIQRAQWSAAIQTVAAKGHYYFFIKREPTQQWYQVPAYVFVNGHNEGKKSFKWEELDVYRCNS